MAGELSKSANITSLKNELKKVRYFYDGSTGRTTFIVEAPRDATDGAPALVTRFVYADASTLRVQGTTEYVGEWNAAWDISETTPS